MEPSMGIISFAYGLFNQTGGWIKRRFRKPEPKEVIQKRIEWKTLFADYIRDIHRKGLAHKVLIRDTARHSQYPNAETKGRGASPWFPIELVQTYHHGIVVLLRIESMVRDGATGQWRVTSKLEEEELKGYVVGHIPYEWITGVDWDGDEYYSFPHIYCEYCGRDREPYQEVLVCQKKQLDDDPPFYTELAKHKDAKRLQLKRERDGAKRK